MLGIGAAVGAVAAVAPSQVWPFRKIFLPAFKAEYWGLPTWVIGSDNPLARLMKVAEHTTGYYPGMFGAYPALTEASVEALELEHFAKEIPDLLSGQSAMFEMYKRQDARIMGLDRKRIGMRVPMRFEAVDPSNADDVKCAEAATKVLNLQNGSRVLYETIPSLHGISYVPGDMSFQNLNRSEVIAGSLNQKPRDLVREVARDFRDSLKVSNDDLGFEDWDG